MFFIAFKNSSQKEYILAHRLKGSNPDWKGMWKISSWQEQAAETPQLGKNRMHGGGDTGNCFFNFIHPWNPVHVTMQDAVHTPGQSFSPQRNVSGNFLPDIPRDVSPS